MIDQELPEVPDEQATPALGSELVASFDSGEPLEVSQLYAGVRRLLDTTTSDGRRVGDCKHGVYLFVDYDGEPIYVGQTREKLRTRIRRHLTNQRTDAVAMRVLDPFEVSEIEMWPFWELDGLPPSEIKETLQKAEFTVYQAALEESQFNAVLNEGEIPAADMIAPAGVGSGHDSASRFTTSTRAPGHPAGKTRPNHSGPRPGDQRETGQRRHPSHSVGTGATP